MASLGKKVLLIGADLRNPQIHKYLDLKKENIKGLSDYIFSEKYGLDNIIIKNGELDIILSGTIPPNPSELLESKKFVSLVEELKKSYDYIVVDSAPCLLVADTFKISKFFKTTLCVVRSNHTSKHVASFLRDLHKEKKLNNMSLVLNGVGSSKAYGYKYGYQYGYQYGYNYGYGYGYTEDKS